MNKQLIIKWGKRVSIAIALVIVILLLYIIFAFVRFYWYIPYQCNSLYQEGKSNANKAITNINKLLNINSDLAYNKALELLTFYSEKGNTKFQVLLGDRLSKDSYYLMRNKAIEYQEKAAYWYMQAAKKGNAEAQGKIGLAYKYGNGVNQDFDKALFWLNNGAENGDSIAQFNLGNIYLNGLAYYSIHYLGKTDDYIYDGNNTFITLENRNYTTDKNETKYILDNPDSIYLKPNITKAKYYWTLSANQGCKSAKDALEKVYE